MSNNMERQAIKDLLYGGICELMQNKRYFYHSPISSDYCHWTEDGERAMIEYLTMMAARMVDADQEQLDQRAKEMVMDGLTK
jgi:hypothetical protein